MSGMAEEIQRQIDADGGAGLAPGSADSPPAEQAPAAGPSTTETPGQQGPPESIPYARFKEVNDRLSELRGYEELAQYGYDPDSLGRLAAFEAQYMTDPVATVARMVEDLDVPQELKDQLTSLAGKPAGSSTPSATPEGGGTPDTQATDPSNLPPDVQEKLRWIDQKQAEEAQQANEAVLDSVLSHWDSLDKEAGLETPKHVQLAFVSAAAAGGGFTNTNQLAEMARGQLMSYRDSTLGSVVGSGRSGGAPALPGSGPAAPELPNFTDLRDASKQALADIQAGRLPT
ncbi:MAG: hypothetical protein EHM23_36115 [Acidobacteria bacterium]|nr:MAG: hypothetical protein EHM23_36115 [Acidobacteriota bacterium]